MKKTTLALMAASLVFAGCNKEIDENAGQQAEQQTLTLSVELNETSKTTYEGAGKVAWAAGDKAWYYTSDGEPATQATIDQAGASATLTINVNADSKYFVGVTGCSSVSNNNVAGLTLTDAVLPVQNGSFGKGHLAVAVINPLTTNKASFKTLTAHVKFTVTDPTVRKVCFSAMNSEQIAVGSSWINSKEVFDKLTVDVSGATPKFTLVAGAGASKAYGKSVITVNIPGPGTYYLAALPVTLAKGFTINEYDYAGRQVAYHTNTNAVPLMAGYVINLGDIDSHTTLETTVVPNADVRAMVAAAGYDLDKFIEVKVALKHFAFYNSTNKNMNLSSVDNGNAFDDTMKKFAATPVFTKSELPYGALVVNKSGYEYRPDGLEKENTTNTSGRPAVASPGVLKVDATWWGKYNYRGFNIDKAGAGALSYAGQLDLKNGFSIFVPKPVNNPELDAIVTANGKNPADYDLIYLGLMQKAYYFSSDANLYAKKVFAATSTATNIPQFCCTRIFTKEDLPNGTLIVNKGNNVRPEGWVYRQRNDGTGGKKRPDPSTTEFTVVDDAWWGIWTERAFNLNIAGVTPTQAQLDQMCANFAIYVPKGQVPELMFK